MSWLGRNGKWYDDVNDCIAADSRYKQQEKQNDLIAEQNLLLQQQMLDQVSREEERRKQEQILVKENRINKLFDDIGISRKEFTKFEEDYLCLYNIMNPYYVEKSKLERELYELENKNVVSSDIISKIIKEDKITFKDIDDLNKSGINEGFVLYRFIRGWCYVWWIFLIILPLCCIDSGLDSSSIIPLLIILLISISPYFMYKNIKNKAISKIRMYTKKGSDNKKKIKILKEKIEDISNKTEQENKNIKDRILKNYDEFIMFRKQHYNSSFEKLLLDLDIDEKYKEYDIEFVKINNSNKSGDGTIEDYLSFIQQKID